jgi:ADP-ribose pyrophosphatase YjhB (NUDIX family)
MAFWMTALPGGGFAMGEAPDEAAARAMIESQQRGSVTFHERTGRYRWTVVLDHGKTSHGWADTRDEAWWFVWEALHRPYRGTRRVRPRGLWQRPPD